MAQVINTNVASLNAQRNLSKSGSSLATSLERLSSGLRINSAKDDAAGLAISDRMSAQIRGLNQAARNANDGISLAQTAEGDLVQIGENLQRMRELTVQANNASNSASDREALNNEIQTLASEIDRVASASAFNGVKLLDGSFANQSFQIGANAGANQQVAISSLTNARSSALGQYQGFTATSGTITNGAAADLTITVTGGAPVTVASVATSAKSIAAAINNAGVSGLTATANATTATGTFTQGITSAGTDTITINGVAITVNGTTDAGTNVANALQAINAQSAATGVSATDAGGVLKLTAADGRNIDVAHSAGTSAGGNLASYGLGTNFGTGATAVTGKVTVDYQRPEGSGVSAISITGAGLGAAFGSSVAATGTAIDKIDLTTVTSGSNFTKYLNSIDAALTTVNSGRADLGAVQTRFSSVISSLQVSAENLSASRSRIVDADFAAETANLTRGQILQQAGTAMLAQANSLPNNVLSLLRG